MKRTFTSIAALSVVLLSGSAFGQTPNTSQATAPKEQKVLRVKILENRDQIQEFQHNVQVLEAERKAVVDLQAAAESEKNAAKKKEIQAKLDAALKKVNEDNDTMTKVYGFSLNRRYVLDYEKASIWMLVSDQEFANLEQQAKAAQEKAKADEQKTKSKK